MEPKKSKKADLRNKQFLFFEVGMIVSIALVLSAFQYSVGEKDTMELTNNFQGDCEVELIPITRQEQKQEKPPVQQTVAALDIVDDLEDIEDPDIDLFSSESNPDDLVAIVPMEEEEEIDEPDFFRVVENMPEFPGGQGALLRFIAENTQYPELAKDNNIQGRVFVEFIVDSKGFVKSAKVIRGVDFSLDKEALRVINSLPRWEPGTQRGKPVNVAFTIPISFQLG